MSYIDGTLTNAEYIDAPRCPICQSVDIVCDDAVDYVEYAMICNHCTATWEELYEQTPKGYANLCTSEGEAA
jgi:hypothetical protein